MKKTFFSHSLQQTTNFANFLAKNNLLTKIVFLSGDVGVGKSFFLKKYLLHLNPDCNFVSPTFLFYKEYKMLNLNVIHIDCYRYMFEFNLEDKLMLLNLLTTPNTLFLIEWAGLLTNFFNKNQFFFDTEVRISYTNEFLKRKFQINCQNWSKNKIFKLNKFFDNENK